MASAELRVVNPCYLLLGGVRKGHVWLVVFRYTTVLVVRLAVLPWPIMIGKAGLTFFSGWDGKAYTDN